eukprot:s6261_g5.t1
MRHNLQRERARAVCAGHPRGPPTLRSSVGSTERKCCTSSRSSPICSAHGFSSRCARLLEPYARAHDAAIWETLELCLGGVATARVAPAQKWQPCLWPSDSAGRMLGGRGYNLLPEFHKLPSLMPACVCWLQAGGEFRASGVQLRHVNFFRQRVGTSALLRKQLARVVFHLVRPIMPWVTGHTDGSAVHRVFATSTFAHARCCHPCRHLLALSSVAGWPTGLRLVDCKTL